MIELSHEADALIGGIGVVTAPGNGPALIIEIRHCKILPMPRVIELESVQSISSKDWCKLYGV